MAAFIVSSGVPINGDATGDNKRRHRVSCSSTERLPCEISREPLRPTVEVPNILARVDDKPRNEFKRASAKNPAQVLPYTLFYDLK